MRRRKLLFFIFIAIIFYFILLLEFKSKFTRLSQNDFVARFKSAHQKNKIVNPHNFNYILNPKHQVCRTDNHEKVFILAMVPIEPSLLKKRNEIRNTWANSHFFPEIKIVFLLGLSSSSYENNKLRGEFEMFADLVQEDFIDSYNNLTLKTIMGFKWASEYCPNAQFLLKVDDDVVVNPIKLVKYLKSKLNVQNTLLGSCYTNAPVLRKNETKFYLTKEEYEPNIFVPYCDGRAYLLSGDLAIKMFNMSFYTHFFRFEDVYVGMLARSLATSFIDIHEQYAFNKSSEDIEMIVYRYQKYSFINLFDRLAFASTWRLFVARYFEKQECSIHIPFLC
jgi:hypothetical protein